MKESKLWLLSGILFGIPLIAESLNQDFSEFTLLGGALPALQAIVTISCFYYYFKKRKEEQKNG